MITPITTQKPIGSGFDKTTSAQQALGERDLSGKRYVVTGASSGIGVETVRFLANAGAEIVAAVRDSAKAEAALAGLQGIRIAELDLASHASIEHFAEALVAEGASVDGLINNAGIMATPLERDADGHELQFAINHLAHFRLTCALWPLLVASGNARVVALSSSAHQFSAFDFEDYDFKQRDYDKFVAYGQSKTANALFAVALDELGKSQNVRAFSVHPGVIATGLTRHMEDEELTERGLLNSEGVIGEAMASRYKTVAQGAATTVWAATNDRLEDIGGLYCEDCDVAALVDPKKPSRGVERYAIDPEAAQKLWTLSEHLTGSRLAG